MTYVISFNFQLRKDDQLCDPPNDPDSRPGLPSDHPSVRQSNFCVSFMLLREVALSASLKPYTLLVCCLRYFLIIFVLQHSICHFWFIFAFLVRKNLLKVNDSKAAGLSIKHPRDPSHSKISIHILNTVLYTFPIVLTKRICFAIKSFFIWWSFPFFSWP